MSLVLHPFFILLLLKQTLVKQKWLKLHCIKLTLILLMAIILTGCVNEFTSRQNQNEIALQQAEKAYQQQALPNLANIDFSKLNPNQKGRYLRLKIAITNPTEVNAQIQNYIELEKYGSTAERQNTINQTWTYLSRLSKTQQQSITIYPDDATLKGWMDLLFIYQENLKEDKTASLLNFLSSDQDNSAQQAENLKQNINNWVTRYPTHPAALYLPRAIFGDDARTTYAPQALNIALFVPQSGASKIYGDAILAGMRDSHLFDDNVRQANIQVYDTNAQPLQTLVQQAEQNQAQMIIGPLLKKNVEALATIKTNLPILALNKLENSLPSSNQVCYFALSPDDEAKNAAKRIYAQQKNAPLLIVPNSTLGKRVAESFIEEWQTLTGQSALPVQFFDNYNQLVAQVNQKKEMPLSGNMMQSQNNQLIPASVDINATPEPIDAVYIYANSEEYILINSLLRTNVNYLPQVYLSSVSNQANLSRDTRYDFNNVQMSDIPLLLNSKLQESLPSYIQDDYFLIRLYAMGVDAVRLSTRFEALQQHQNPILNGLTGTLNTVPACNIEQTLSWGTVNKGNLVPMMN